MARRTRLPLKVSRAKKVRILRSMLIGEAFDKWQRKHPNFMTPAVEKYTVVGNRIVELSSGLGMENEPIYGVTVLEQKGRGRFGSLSDLRIKGLKADQMFHDRAAAERHFDRVSGALG